MNATESISRKKFFSKLRKMPAVRIVGFGLSALLIGSIVYGVWVKRFEISMVVMVYASLALFFAIAGLIPFTAGFVLQFFLRRPISPAIQLLIAGLIVFTDWAVQYKPGEPAQAMPHLIGFVIRIIFAKAFSGYGASFNRWIFRREKGEAPEAKG